MRDIIHTIKAPAAIGSYSQAVRAGNMLYLSGQIPLHPETQALVSEDISAQINQVFENIKMVVESAGVTLDAVVKLTVYLIDLSHIGLVNDIMAEYFQKPFPARTTIQVSALPKQAKVEIEALVNA